MTRLSEAILTAWQTNNRITAFLIENLPAGVWSANIPGFKYKTIQMIGGHLHNTRCMWIKKIGRKWAIQAPPHVARHHVAQAELLSALNRSSKRVQQLLTAAVKHSGPLPGFSLDVVHFLNYLVAHEAHHRGQMIMACRQLQYKLPEKVTQGVWKWSIRSQENKLDERPGYL